MGFALGNDIQEKKSQKEREQVNGYKQISVYSGGRCVLSCYGKIDYYAAGNVATISREDGIEYKVYNGVIIVEQKSKN